MSQPAASAREWRIREILNRQDQLREAVLSFRNWRNRRIDSALNIDTGPPPTGISPRAARFADSVHHEAMDYPLLRHYLAALHLGPNDVAFDIGCGTGRMLCELARHEVALCVGVEISPELAQVAEQNARRLRGRRAPIDVRTGDATDADYHEGTVFCLFNPFGEQTLEAVVEQIGKSLQARPRAIQIAYLHPVHENVLEKCPWLRRVGARRSPWYRARASYFVNDLAGDVG